jgi:hypothetical protein
LLLGWGTWFISRHVCFFHYFLSPLYTFLSRSVYDPRKKEGASYALYSAFSSPKTH